VDSFKDLTLSPELTRAITELGYTKPSPIQAEALPILLAAPTDFVGLAATGTGKTAAFGIPLIEQLDAHKKGVQALVLCPTRELALQVCEQINLLGKYKKIKAIAVYGGSSIRDQIYDLQNGAEIVVGTPGRVIDHTERGTLKLDQLRMVVLDEADEMISMGFKEELDAILKKVPREHAHFWLFSATMSRDVQRVADTYLRKAKRVQVNKQSMLSTTVEQQYFVTQESNKPEILCKLIDAAENFYGLIFCQTKALVADLTDYLLQRGYQVECLHGDMDQKARERVMNNFRGGRLQMLVCTDVAARGLDVKDVTHVVNYTIPRELDSYVHRIGRTARSGKAGLAMSLVTPANARLIPRIEQLTQSRMKQGKIPSSKDVAAKKMAALIPRFENQQGFARVQTVMGESWKTAIASMSPEEIVARFASMLLPELAREPERRSFEGQRHHGQGRNRDSQKPHRRH
jgi:ATP-dependent RNA helicase DeaD